MARIRSVKPEFFLNEAVASLPFEWRLLFIGLWTMADRDGRLEDRPLRIKASLFPYDDVTVEDGLRSLVDAGLIVRYTVDGRSLIEIPTWQKHQQPHIREAVSQIPSAGTGLAPGQHPGSGSGSGSGKGGEGVRRADLKAGFDCFWALYPRKIGKDAAWAEWLRRSPTLAETEAILNAVSVQRASAQWHEEGGKWVPHPRTWLHQGRWKDEIAEASEQQRPQPRTLTLLEELWAVMHSTGHWQDVLACEGPDGAGVVRVRVKSLKGVDSFRPQLEAKLTELRPGARLEIVEATND